MTLADLLTLGVLLAVAALLLLANYGARYQTARILSLIAGGLLAGTGLTLGVLGALLTLVRYAAGTLSVADLGRALSATLPIAVAGILGILYLLPSFQRAAGRLLPLRPGSPVSYTAVVLSLVFLGLQVPVVLLGPQQGLPPVTAVDILIQDVPLILIGFVGVGLVARRSLRGAAERLGLTPPRQVRWWLIAMLAVPAFIVVATGIDAVGNVIAPASQKQVTDVSTVLFSRFNTVPAIVFLGVTAGVAEEILFRGAMLPRFGLVLTALLFAAVHTQYAITFATLEVFVLGLGLGWLRTAGGTLPAIVTHAGYDITVGLLSLHH